MRKIFPVLQYMNVPNFITTLGLVFGIIACYFLTIGDLRSTLICLFISAFLDLTDGFLAGKLNQKTLFGQQADSLVDFFICCIMPVLIVYTFLEYEIFLVGSVIFYCICGLWRLAYYNVTSSENGNYFIGLPVPGALLLATMVIWSVMYYNLSIIICAAAFFLIGLLMVSFIKLEKYGICQKLSWVIGLVFLIMVVLS